jgi:ribonuclease-3
LPAFLEKSEKYILKPDKKSVKQFRKILGFRPGKPELYQLALVHKSAAHKLYHNPKLNNERLEFLGDAILDSVVAEHLFSSFPHKDEGFLTQLRSKIVNRETLKRISLKLGLGNLVVSKVSNDNHKAVYGDALEAFIGAIYLDKGYRRTRKFILERIIDHHINLKKLSQTEIDFKSRIIEWVKKIKRKLALPAGRTMLPIAKYLFLFLICLFLIKLWEWAQVAAKRKPNKTPLARHCKASKTN